MRMWQKEDLDKLNGFELYQAAVEAGVWKARMTKEEAREALLNPFSGDEIPDWAKSMEDPSSDLWRKLVAKLPKPIQTVLKNIEFDEVILPLLFHLLDNYHERKKYVTQDNMLEFAREVNARFDALSTPERNDDTVAATGFARFLTKDFWSEPLFSTKTKQIKK